MNKKKHILVILLLVITIIFSQSVYAKLEMPERPFEKEDGGKPSSSTTTTTPNISSPQSSGNKTPTTSGTTNKTGGSMAWWGQAQDFWNGASSNVANDAIKSLDGLVNVIKVIGNMVFVAVTVILGVKYIWGGVDSKASVKDSLITLVVAALVFYGWNTISALFISGNNLVFLKGNAEATALSIYSTILYVCNFLAVGGVIYIGIKYLMAGAEGKSQLKVQAVPVVLGIIMVYATLTFLNFIVGII